MAKKLFLTIFLSIVFIIGLTTIAFAQSTNTTTAIGNEVTKSMNKTEKSMNDLVDKTDINETGNNIENGAKDFGNTIKNGMDDMGRTVEEFVGSDNVETNGKTENTTVAGTTGNFTSSQIQTDTDSANRNGMTQNAWIWIVMVVVALIIVAAVWFYAAQK